MWSTLCAVALPAVMLAAGAARPAEDGGAKSEVRANDAPPSQEDVETLAKLHHDSGVAIHLGELAKKVGASKQVRAYGAVLVKDYALADKELRSFAKRTGVELKMPALKEPAELSKLQARMDALERLEATRGAQFDRQLVEMMRVQHQRAVKLAEATLSRTQSSKVQAVLNKLLPVLKEHLRLTEHLEARLNPALPRVERGGGTQR